MANGHIFLNVRPNLKEAPDIFTYMYELMIADILRPANYSPTIFSYTRALVTTLHPRDRVDLLFPVMDPCNKIQYVNISSFIKRASQRSSPARGNEVITGMFIAFGSVKRLFLCGTRYVRIM